MDHLQQALDQVHAALEASEPHSAVQEQLTAVQSSLLQYIWHVTVRTQDTQRRNVAA